MAKTTAQLLTSIVNSKEAIRQSIVAKGQACDKDVPLSQYAGKIRSITSGTEIVVQSNADFYQCVFCADGVWSGYKAVLEDGQYHFETTITEGLKYTNVKPEVGKIYTVDALAQIAYLYDIGGTGGQCPNLSDCVSITCPDCNEKYCQTHDSHQCEDDDDDDEKCPNLPTCAPVNCATCGKKYCTTHQQHECDNDDDDNPNPNPDPNPKPAECPYGEGCIADICTVCSTTYCTVHDTHECTQAECPNGPNCMPTACACGASYCAIHSSHPTDVCCANNTTCNYVTCTTCSTTYCTKHGTHTSAQCCPNSSNCHVEECESRDCAKTYCTRHSGFEHPCPLCGGEFCSKSCYIDHGCSNLQQCSADGCGNNAYDDCSKCSKRFCIYHLTDHECKTGNMCWVSGCSKGGTECKAVGCDRIVCTDHATLCKACNPEEYYCSEHINNHNCSGVKCARCNSTIGVRSCAICGMFMCNACINDGIGSECAECNRLICSTCMTSELHTCGTEPDVHCYIASCTAEEIQPCHAGCGKWTCNGHGYVCLCDELFCPDCGVSHDCEADGGCSVTGCNETVAAACSDCGKLVCSKHSDICNICTNAVCLTCRESHTHECSVDGCSNSAPNECAECGKSVCEDHYMICQGGTDGATCGLGICTECDGTRHSHETVNKCPVGDCQSPGVVSCTCGTYYCDWHKQYQPYSCEICGKTVCENCVESHECTATKTCSVDGCSSTAISYTCADSSCGKKYCSNHSPDAMATKDSPIRPCSVCGNWYCASHNHTCTTGGGCEVSGCNNTDVGYCGNCEKHICASHANECEACGSMIFCPDCWAEHAHNTEITCEVAGCSGTIVSHCADCAKQLCSDHRIICETCGAPPLCPDCWSPHNHDTESKCCISGCPSEGKLVPCPNCGAVYCGGHLGAYNTQCSECQTLLCHECASSHECATTETCTFCSKLATDHCPDCGKPFCADCASAQISTCDCGKAVWIHCPLPVGTSCGECGGHFCSVECKNNHDCTAV